ncbi:hypothetical protein BDR04DRAFT_1103585 [Suillus decipiens]|nr:hypothetical protein BDR04DRAFT_1103585 [Suillus decipiens]
MKNSLRLVFSCIQKPVNQNNEEKHKEKHSYKSCLREAKATTEARSKLKSTATSKKTVEQPPSRSPNAYLLFFSKLVRDGEGDINVTMNAQDMIREAAATWNGFSSLAEVIYIAQPS